MKLFRNCHIMSICEKSETLPTCQSVSWIIWCFSLDILFSGQYYTVGELNFILINIVSTIFLNWDLIILTLPVPDKNGVRVDATLALVSLVPITPSSINDSPQPRLGVVG